MKTASPFKLVGNILRAEFELPDDGCPAPNKQRLVVDVRLSDNPGESHIIEVYTMSGNNRQQRLCASEVPSGALADLLYPLVRVRTIEVLELI